VQIATADVLQLKDLTSLLLLLLLLFAAAAGWAW
jgi:hypothetical protein